MKASKRVPRLMVKATQVVLLRSAEIQESFKVGGLGGKWPKSSKAERLECERLDRLGASLLREAMKMVRSL